jgi:hypothetical protein
MALHAFTICRRENLCNVWITVAVSLRMSLYAYLLSSVIVGELVQTVAVSSVYPHNQNMHTHATSPPKTRSSENQDCMIITASTGTGDSSIKIWLQENEEVRFFYSRF